MKLRNKQSGNIYDSDQITFVIYGGEYGEVEETYLSLSEMNQDWEEVKPKQAENIAKLYEKNPDDWFYEMQMKLPEAVRTGFAPNDSKCYYCDKAICEGDKAITVESLGEYIITGCPYCHRSYCD